MIRVALSVVAGYLVIAMFVLATDAILGGLLRGDRDLFTTVNLATALPYAVAGGWIAARIAPGKELTAGVGLCAFALVMSVITLVLDRGNQPLWYWVALLVLIVMGAGFGAFLRKKQTRLIPRPV